MPIRCVYTDLDGTLLGRGGSLFRDAEGNFSLLSARALEACHRVGAEVVIKSGRRKAQVMEDARLLGQTSYVYEIGCGVVVDGEETFLTGELQPRAGASVHDQIEQSGAPALLFERYAGRLEYHEPWHRHRQFTHLMRGNVDVGEVNGLLAEQGLAHLRLVDNGVIAPKPSLPGLEVHAYHLIPATASKAAGVAFHMRARGYAPAECIAVGDSAEDLGVAQHVGRFFLVGADQLPLPDNAERAESFYEAVVRSLID
jgi:hypothetical protein